MSQLANPAKRREPPASNHMVEFILKNLPEERIDGLCLGHAFPLGFIVVTPTIGPIVNLMGIHGRARA
ncbi:MAG: hypothetical protein E4H01_08420 [Lysobacterales bacterium]|nr:MAG: hypothetical protein E4H01_08420 [Xanthomonadales bacterium]